MILVDTSAWVEFDRKIGSAVDNRLADLIATTDQVATCEPIIMELAAAAKDRERERQLRRLLGRFELLIFDSPTDFDAAVAIYRRCQAQGVTPRGLIDCLIASVALRHSASVLCKDKDLIQVADVMGITLDEASI